MKGMTEDSAAHREKMQKKKAVRDRMMAKKTADKGLLIVHTGTGKGKSTAAFGMALRAIGHGMRIGIVQFVKGAWTSGERGVFERFGEQVRIEVLGEGFTWETQDRQRDIRAARRAWEAAKTMIAEDGYSMIILDELNIVLRYDYLPLDEVLAAVASKPAGLHLVITGRNAPAELMNSSSVDNQQTAVAVPPVEYTADASR